MATRFNPDIHIVNLAECSSADVSDGAGGFFKDIAGFPGANAVLDSGDPIGVDSIVMQAGTAFGLHTHPGAHLLVVTEGKGSISIDGVDYKLRDGDSIYVPAAYAHGVRAALDCGLAFIAFGMPHMPVSSEHRMTLVEAGE